MSFRFADLKKSVRKAKDGHVVLPMRLEGRAPAFRIEFLLQQFEGHLGRPRHMLDPNSLLDFVGDARLGRGLLATLAQWYRMRPRTFAEALDPRYPGGAWQSRLAADGIAGPVDLRAWLYTAVNRGGRGYLDPDGETVFWQAEARALGLRREELPKLMLLDRPEEAVLVRTGPRPAAADVMAAYNARALTTLLRSATEVALDSDAPAALLERAARTWADPLQVEWRIEDDALRLFGRADALGCWTRHGRRVERAALELLALPDLGVRELHGQVTVAERSCRFQWRRDTLSLLGAARGAPLHEDLPDHVTTLAIALRRERDRAERSPWSIRRAVHLIAVEGGVCLPHLELRYGDLSLYLRLTDPRPPGGAALAPFLGKTPVALVTWSGDVQEPITLHLPGEAPESCATGDLLATLAGYLDRARKVAEAPERRPTIKSAA